MMLLPLCGLLMLGVVSAIGLPKSDHHVVRGESWTKLEDGCGQGVWQDQRVLAAKEEFDGKMTERLCLEWCNGQHFKLCYVGGETCKGSNICVAAHGRGDSEATIWEQQHLTEETESGTWSVVNRGVYCGDVGRDMVGLYSEKDCLQWCDSESMNFCMYDPVAGDHYCMGTWKCEPENLKTAEDRAYRVWEKEWALEVMDDTWEMFAVGPVCDVPANEGHDTVDVRSEEECVAWCHRENVKYCHYDTQVGDHYCQGFWTCPKWLWLTKDGKENGLKEDADRWYRTWILQERETEVEGVNWVVLHRGHFCADSAKDTEAVYTEEECLTWCVEEGAGFCMYDMDRGNYCKASWKCDELQSVDDRWYRTWQLIPEEIMKVRGQSHSEL